MVCCLRVCIWNNLPTDSNCPIQAFFSRAIYNELNLYSCEISILQRVLHNVITVREETKKRKVMIPQVLAICVSYVLQ